MQITAHPELSAHKWKTSMCKCNASCSWANHHLRQQRLASMLPAVLVLQSARVMTTWPLHCPAHWRAPCHRVIAHQGLPCQMVKWSCPKAAPAVTSQEPEPRQRATGGLHLFPNFGSTGTSSLSAQKISADLALLAEQQHSAVRL